MDAFPAPLQGAIFLVRNPGVVVATLLNPGLRSVIPSGFGVHAFDNPYPDPNGITEISLGSRSGGDGYPKNVGKENMTLERVAEMTAAGCSSSLVILGE